MNIVNIQYQVAEQQGYKVYKPQDVYDVLKEHFNPLQEEFYLLPVVGQEFCIERLFVGGLTQASTDLKTMFHLLLTKYPNAPSFIIAHNHPSGDCEPSYADKEITKQIKKLANCWAILCWIIWFSAILAIIALVIKGSLNNGLSKGLA